jgi:hypothetical protein
MTYSCRVLSFFGQDRTRASGKTRGDGLCIFVNNSWCTKSKEVSRFCSPEVEYLMISCRPHYLPRDFSSVFFVAVYIPPQTDAGTKTALNELYTSISKQEKTLDHLYSTHRDTYKALPHPPFCKSDHNYMKAGSTSDSVNKEVLR